MVHLPNVENVMHSARNDGKLKRWAITKIVRHDPCEEQYCVNLDFTKDEL